MNLKEMGREVVSFALEYDTAKNYCEENSGLAFV